MNEGAVFLVGIVIFAITIYGAVMAGGMALTKVVLDQESQQQPEAKDGQLAPSVSPHMP
jgi:hypothetical protein